MVNVLNNVSMTNKRIKRSGSKGWMFGLMMAFILVLSNLISFDSQASAIIKLDKVYLGGPSAKDTNTGKDEQNSVASFARAKELVNIDGTIEVVGNLYISGEESWSLGAGLYGNALVNLENSMIVISSAGSLTLSNIVLKANTSVVVNNSGVLNLNKGSVIKVNNCSVNDSAVTTLTGGSTLVDGIVVKGVANKTNISSEESASELNNDTSETAAETTTVSKLANNLSVTIKDTTYGNSLVPVISENTSQAEISYFYKSQGADDATYTSTVPTQAGSYTIKAVSAETSVYATAQSTADFAILKASPAPVTFPIPTRGQEGNALSSVSLKDGSGSGEFYWANGTQLLAVKNKGYEVIFKPTDVMNYDYSLVKGWDHQSETIKAVLPVAVIPAQVVKGNSDLLTDNVVSSDISEGQLETIEELETPQTDYETLTSIEDGNTETTPESMVNETAFIEEIKGSAGEDIITGGNTLMTEIPESQITSVIVDNDKIKISILAIKAIPKEIRSIDDVNTVITATYIYECLSPSEQAQISDGALATLVGAQEKALVFNHTSNKVTVTGGEIPWYVQLRVLVKPVSEHAQVSDLQTVIIPYEIKLWNLMTQTEYQLVAGEEATLAMSISGLVGYDEIIVAHYLSDGTVEYITPEISGDTISFTTSSFSPFDVGGSQVLVPPQVDNTPTKGNDNQQKTTTSSETQVETDNSNITDKSNQSVNNSATNTIDNTEKNSNSTNHVSNDRSTNAGTGSNNQTSTPKTGDQTPIFLLIAALAIAALALIILFVSKKKKK